MGTQEETAVYDTLVDMRRDVPLGDRWNTFRASSIDIVDWKDSEEVQFVLGSAGVFAFSLPGTAIPYPFGPSRLVYIGKADRGVRRRTNLAVRIYRNLDKEAVRNYYETLGDLEISVLLFRHPARNQPAEAKARLLDAFRKKLGCPPIANGRRR